MSPQLCLDDSNLREYLENQGLVPAGEPLSVTPAGDGNINWVRRARVEPDGPSWIVKQARPALERFPEYRVTTERIAFEARYYEVAAPFDRRRTCPRVIRFDPEARVLVLEDLCGAERLDAALGRGAPVGEALAGIGAFLGAVHAGTRGADLSARFENREMVRLHGDHVFSLPFRENEFPLSERLAARAAALRQDRRLRQTLDAAYARYLGCRVALVHGDVQSANILLASDRPVLLDAEIAHVGDPAFDVGSLVAHLLMPALARRAPGSALPALGALFGAYRGAGGRELRFADAARYAGIEMARRTIGAARLAWADDGDAAERVLDLGLALVRHPPGSPGDLASLLADASSGRL